MSPSAERPDVTFEGATPILSVRDLAASLAYWTGALGFHVVFRGTLMACVARGAPRVFLVEGDQGQPGTWLWIGVSDVDALRRELVANGARLRHGPVNLPWAYEMHVEDPDGHVLRFGSERRDDVPDGDWLDQRGVLWRRDGDAWTKVSAS
jgi:catechol 2,3-dioxygenase-like lactoylglutathione lyase family enzyme